MAFLGGSVGDNFADQNGGQWRRTSNGQWMDPTGRIQGLAPPEVTEQWRTAGMPNMGQPGTGFQLAGGGGGNTTGIFPNIVGGAISGLGSIIGSNQRGSAVDRALALANPASVAGPGGSAAFTPDLVTLGLSPDRQAAFNAANQGLFGNLDSLANTNFQQAEADELSRLQTLRQPQIDAARTRLQSQQLNRGREGLGVGGGLTGNLFNPQSAALEESIARTQLTDIGAARQMAQGQQSFLADQAQSLVGTGNQITAPLLQQAQVGIQSRVPAALAGLEAAAGATDAATTQGFFSGFGNTIATNGLGALGDLFGGGATDALGAAGGAVGNTVPGASASVPTPSTGGGLFGGAGGFGAGAFDAGTAILGGAGAFPGILGSGFGLGATGVANTGALGAATLADFGLAASAIPGATTGIAAGGGAAAAAPAGGGLFGGLGALGALGTAAIAAPTIAGIVSKLMGATPNAAAKEGFTKLFGQFSSAAPITIPAGQPGAGQAGIPLQVGNRTVYVDPNLDSHLNGEGFRVVGSNDVVRPNIDTGAIEVINFGATNVAAQQRQIAIAAGVPVRGQTSDQISATLQTLANTPAPGFAGMNALEAAQFQQRFEDAP